MPSSVPVRLVVRCVAIGDRCDLCSSTDPEFVVRPLAHDGDAAGNARRVCRPCATTIGRAVARRGYALSVDRRAD